MRGTLALGVAEWFCYVNFTSIKINSHPRPGELRGTGSGISIFLKSSRPCDLVAVAETCRSVWKGTRLSVSKHVRGEGRAAARPGSGVSDHHGDPG